MIEVRNPAIQTDTSVNRSSARLSASIAALAIAALGLAISPISTAQTSTSATKSQDTAQSFNVKIGFVNTQRILQDSGPSKKAQEAIEQEFKKRNDDLQKEIAEFRKKVQAFEKDAPVLAESDRNRRQRELGNLDADLQRKQREIQEDFNRRRNEEFAIIIERANAAIMEIAEKEAYDLILQDAVTVSERVDITEKVIKTLESKQ